MNFVELLVISVALSMDAFAISVCKGLSVGRIRPVHAVTCGLYFGGSQAVMPLIGWALGVRFQHIITSVDHWIAFAFLAFIGVNMIRESRCEEETVNVSLAPAAMLPLAIATSIDALAVGITLAFLEANILVAVTAIGVITFLLSCAGVWVGSVFGARWRGPAELVGGSILVLMGLKILLEHLGLLPALA